MMRTMLVCVQHPGTVHVNITLKNGSNNISIAHKSSLLPYCVTGGIISKPLHSLAICTPRAKRDKLFTSDLLIK
jgi:hypothetical protein